MTKSLTEEPDWKAKCQELEFKLGSMESKFKDLSDIGINGGYETEELIKLVNSLNAQKESLIKTIGILFSEIEIIKQNKGDLQDGFTGEDKI